MPEPLISVSYSAAYVRGCRKTKHICYFLKRFTRQSVKEFAMRNLDHIEGMGAKGLEALQSMPDGDIDYSDIPPLGDEFWQNAIRNPFYKPTKTAHYSTPVDSDVLMWPRSKGKGYQTRINAILREAMLRELK